MRAVPLLFALLLSSLSAASCGGKVILPSGSNGDGGGGAGGAGGTAQGTGNPKDCPDANCTMNGDICSCETLCGGPKLRADCKIHDGGMLICECHYDGGYMGTCSSSNGALCGLPDGCCEAYVP